ncbi:MAG: DUF5320 domain-containing protein [bacterium]|nr:DUF5320 domain-containing protein [bacterium]
MPGGDGTGPMGMGPQTGRGAGFCGGFEQPGYMNPVGRGGMGFGRGGRGRGAGGGGRGWRNRFYATGVPGWMQFGQAPFVAQPAPEQQRAALEAQANALQQQLDAIRQRLDELSAGVSGSD